MNHRHRPPNEWSSHRLNWAVGQSMPGSVGLWFEERRLQCYETCEEACAVTDVWHSCKRRTIKGGTEQSESTGDNGGRCLLPHLGVWSSKECSQVSVSQDNMRVCSHTHMHRSLFVWMHFISWPCFNQCWYLKVQYRTVCRTLLSFRTDHRRAAHLILTWWRITCKFNTTSSPYFYTNVFTFIKHFGTYLRSFPIIYYIFFIRF